MNKILIVIFIFTITHCSFDNKTGIWKNSNEISITEQNIFKDFETLYTDEKLFAELISPKNNANIILNKIVTSLDWTDEFYQNSNNSKNFSYKNLNKVIFKSKKLSRYKINDKLLFNSDEVILADKKGNVIFYSTKNKIITYKFNFYKKRYRKLDKKLNLIIKDSIVYVADNLGYLYAIDCNTKKLLWAKYYKIPFRSNLKIIGDKIILADQNNSLYVVSKLNGERLKTHPTEETILKSDFYNSIALNNDSLFYLNTYGSFYSFNKKSTNINWFVSLNRSLDLNANNLFKSNPIISYGEKLIISTKPFLYILDSNNGASLFKKTISSSLTPVASGNSLFIVTENNLLVCIDLKSNKILYSVDIGQEISDYLNSKKKTINIKYFSIVNNNILIFLDNSYFVIFNKNGKIKNINKLKNRLETSPIYINNSILYLNKKNKLVILN